MIALIMALMMPSHARTLAEEPADSTPNFDYTFQVLRGNQILMDVDDVEVCDEVAWLIHAQRHGYVTLLAIDSDGIAIPLVPSDRFLQMGTVTNATTILGYFGSSDPIGINRVILIWSNSPINERMLRNIPPRVISLIYQGGRPAGLVEYFARMSITAEFDVHTTTTVPDTNGRWNERTQRCSVETP